MGVTFIPGPPQYGQGGGQENLVQLAMAVKSFKMQEKQQKQQEAASRVQLLENNPQLLLLQNPKALEKDLKTLGIEITDQPIASPDQALQTPAPSGTPSMQEQTGQPANVDPNALAALGNTMQPKAGAQAATPPSASAAAKAPGGGVTPTGGGDVTERLAAQAHDMAMQKYGKLAPLYLGAATELQRREYEARTVDEINRVKQGAARGDFQSMGRLMLLSGKQISDSDMRAMLISSNMDPRIQAQALDFALGNETEADKAKRFDSTLKTLSSNPNFMDRLTNPSDITEYARAVVYGGTVPNISMKPHTLAELTQETEYEKYLVTEAGLAPDIAHAVARGRTDGISVDAVLPPAFQSIAARKASAQERESKAAEEQADAALIRAKADGLKIQQELSSKKYDILNDRLRTMIEADKAKHPFPDDIRDGILNDVAHEVGLQPERVKKWYQLWGKGDWQYTPLPDTDLARQAAGPPPKAPAGKRQPSLKEFVPPGSTIPNPFDYLMYLMTGRAPQRPQ